MFCKKLLNVKAENMKLIEENNKNYELEIVINLVEDLIKVKYEGEPPRVL